MPSNLKQHATEHQLDITKPGVVLVHAMATKIINLTCEEGVDLTCEELEISNIVSCNTVPDIITIIKDKIDDLLFDFYAEECGETGGVWPDEVLVETCPHAHDCARIAAKQSGDTKKEVSRLSKVAALLKILKWLGVKDKK